MVSDPPTGMVLTRPLHGAVASREEPMTVRYREAEDEKATGQQALELLRTIVRLGEVVDPGDPVRRALVVARRAFEHALSLSPVLRVDGRPTVFELALPHGSNALGMVEETWVDTEVRLQRLYELAIDVPDGPAAIRRKLVCMLVQAAHRLHRVLRGELELSRGVSTAQLREALAAILNLTEVRKDAPLPLYLESFAIGVDNDFRYVSDVPLDLALVCAALAGLVQAEDRGPGRLPKGALSHLNTVYAVLADVDLLPEGAKEATGPGLANMTPRMSAAMPATADKPRQNASWRHQSMMAAAPAGAPAVAGATAAAKPTRVPYRRASMFFHTSGDGCTGATAAVSGIRRPCQSCTAPRRVAWAGNSDSRRRRAPPRSAPQTYSAASASASAGRL